MVEESKDATDRRTEILGLGGVGEGELRQKW